MTDHSSHPASETLLRRLLWLDAASCLLFALLLAAAGGPLEQLTGIPRAVHLAALAVLLPAGALMAFCAARAPMFRAGVRLIIAGNGAWALASLALAMDASAAGAAFLLVQALFAAAMAVLEHSQLRRLDRPRTA